MRMFHEIKLLLVLFCKARGFRIGLVSYRQRRCVLDGCDAPMTLTPLDCDPFWDPDIGLLHHDAPDIVLALDRFVPDDLRDVFIPTDGFARPVFRSNYSYCGCDLAPNVAM